VDSINLIAGRPSGKALGDALMPTPLEVVHGVGPVPGTQRAEMPTLLWVSPFTLLQSPAMFNNTFRSNERPVALILRGVWPCLRRVELLMWC
jgi:hypothetical protein